MIEKNVSLKSYNTFGLDYSTDYMIHIKTLKEAEILLTEDSLHKKPILIMGSGSNLLFLEDFRGTIMHPELTGIKIEEYYSDNVIISAGAGVIWDNFVDWSVNNGFAGLENLSLIPGTVGASAVQNIGAYGVEVKDSIRQVSTLSMANGSERSFSNNECEFGYRNSIFKRGEKGNYLITRVYFRLSVSPLFNLSYGSLKEEVDILGGANLLNVRQAVINIRRSKLPDPEIIGNAGSFFKNPIVERSVANDIKKKYPQILSHDDLSGSIKLPAGWLIDQCGWKGRRIGDAGVHEKQALVLVNFGKATGRDIYNLSEAIKKSVLEKFGIELEREVEVIGVI
jgi:UDP-N-acetylmuramate dehydrogenase